VKLDWTAKLQRWCYCFDYLDEQLSLAIIIPIADFLHVPYLLYILPRSSVTERFILRTTCANGAHVDSLDVSLSLRKISLRSRSIFVLERNESGTLIFPPLRSQFSYLRCCNIVSRCNENVTLGSLRVRWVSKRVSEAIEREKIAEWNSFLISERT